MSRFAKIRAAAATLVQSVKTDHAAMQSFHAKYGGRPGDPSALPRDLVEKIGFQLMAAYRVMRFLGEIEAPLASRIASRVIRHAYGSDVHWDAEIAPGVMVVHGMGLAISHSARVEEGVLIFQHCTLGEGRHPDTQEVGAPTVEKGAVIGAGAVIVGPVTIGARTKIMPGCVVVRSVPPDSLVESPAPVVRPRARAARRVPSGEASAPTASGGTEPNGGGAHGR